MNNNNAKHIFHQFPSIALEFKISSNAKMVLMVLYDIIKDVGHSRHRNKTLAQKLRLSERTIARCLNELERAELIIRKGLSFTRKFFLGKMFELSAWLYKQTKKNLPRDAKKKGKSCPSGKHNQTCLTNNKKRGSSLSVSEQYIYDCYKNNPLLKIPQEYEYLFE